MTPAEALDRLEAQLDYDQEGTAEMHAIVATLRAALSAPTLSAEDRLIAFIDGAFNCPRENGGYAVPCKLTASFSSGSHWEELYGELSPDISSREWAREVLGMVAQWASLQREGGGRGTATLWVDVVSYTWPVEPTPIVNPPPSPAISMKTACKRLEHTYVKLRHAIEMCEFVATLRLHVKGDAAGGMVTTFQQGADRYAQDMLQEAHDAVLAMNAAREAAGDTSEAAKDDGQCGCGECR